MPDCVRKPIKRHPRFWRLLCSAGRRSETRKKRTRPKFGEWAGSRRCGVTPQHTNLNFNVSGE